MSGDFDTGFGNSALNYAVLYSFLEQVKHYIMLDGDDSVVIVESDALSALDFGHFEKMGFLTECKIVTELHEVEFCRAKLLNTTPPRFARDARRSLSNMLVSYKRFEAVTAPRYLAGRGLAELAVSNGVPILGVIARKLAELSDKPIMDQDIIHKYGNATVTATIDDAVRVAYALAWGYSIAEQLEFEKYTPGVIELSRWLNSLPDE